MVPHSRQEALERSKRRFVKHAMPRVVEELGGSALPAPAGPIQFGGTAPQPGQARRARGAGPASPPGRQRAPDDREASGLEQDYLPPHMTRRLLRAISAQKSRYESRIAQLEARLGESQLPSAATSAAEGATCARTKSPHPANASPRSPGTPAAGTSAQAAHASALPGRIPRSPAEGDALGARAPP